MTCTGRRRCANVSDDNVTESRGTRCADTESQPLERVGRAGHRVHDSRIEGLSRGMTGAAYAPPHTGLRRPRG